MTLRPAHSRIVFVVSIILWTIALLVPVPQKSVEALGGQSNAFYISKVLHGSAYAYLTVLGGLLATTNRQRWLVLGLLSFHGFATEFLQSFVNRGASLRDVGVDHIGILIGVLAGWRHWRKLVRHEAENGPP